jgi:catechol 2,3-dioxygenase-like lactoylglutathione lyase family enzyme
MEFHRGRLIDHVGLQVRDLGASKRFYRAILKAIGREKAIVEADDYFSADELWISQTDKAITQVHLAFMAKDQEQVKAFYTAALAAGGRDNGPPGERKYHPGYYAAFAFDPDGHNVEAVFHGPFTASAESVVFKPKT